MLSRRIPGWEEVYARLGWKMFTGIDRVYVDEKARRELGWQPQFDFGRVLGLVEAGLDFQSQLAREVGSKGYHHERFEDGPYPVA